MREPTHPWRYRCPLLLLAAGLALWRAGVPVPGTPLVILGLNAGDVAVANDGSLCISDYGNHAVWRVRRWHTPRRVASTSDDLMAPGSSIGGPMPVKLSMPSHIAVSAQGDIYVAEWARDRVRKVDTRGIVTTVAGTLEAGYTGDGRLAVETQLLWPIDVATDARGSLYIAEGRCVREVDGKGIITTVAGTALGGFSGDGGPAVEAKLQYAEAVVVGPRGDLYVTDGARVRKVDTRGIITTVAGTGQEGYGGDGGPAVKAKIRWAEGLAVDSRGDLYFADSGNNRVRKVDARGIITTVAGTGKSGYSGDGGPAVKAGLAGPSAVAVDARGDLYIAEGSRVRKVDARGIITTVVAASRFPR